MSDLKKMYTTLQEDPFPADLDHQPWATQSLRLRQTHLDHRRRRKKGLALRRKPRPARSGLCPVGRRRTEPGRRGLSRPRPRAWSRAMPPKPTCIQSGKHPGKTNLTDVDNGREHSAISRQPNRQRSFSSTTTPAARPGAGKPAWPKPSELAFTCPTASPPTAEPWWSTAPSTWPPRELINARAFFEVVAAPDYQPEALALLQIQERTCACWQTAGHKRPGLPGRTALP